MYPPDFPWRRLGCQRVEHCEHGGRPDTRAQQNDGGIARAEREAASGRARVKHITNLQLVADVSASRATGFPFDAHAISVGTGFARQRITAK